MRNTGIFGVPVPTWYYRLTVIVMIGTGTGTVHTVQFQCCLNQVFLLENYPVARAKINKKLRLQHCDCLRCQIADPERCGNEGINFKGKH